jgi:hypothetical protein
VSEHRFLTPKCAFKDSFFCFLVTVLSDLFSVVYLTTLSVVRSSYIASNDMVNEKCIGKHMERSNRGRMQGTT